MPAMTLPSKDCKTGSVICEKVESPTAQLDPNRIDYNAIGKRRAQHGNKPNSHKPQWTGDQLRQQLRLYDRAPFLDLLAVWMECAPEPEDILDFAAKHPDRYIMAISNLGKLGGFTEKREIDVDIHVHVRGLSDSQLEDRFRELATKMGMEPPKVITADFEDVPAAPVE